jgi:hypothetical protein
LINLIVEIYRADGSRSCILEKSMDGVRSELQRLAGSLDPEPVIDYLMEQQKDPKVFPNVIVFLNEVGQQIGIDDFMRKK